MYYGIVFHHDDAAYILAIRISLNATGNGVASDGVGVEEPSEDVVLRDNARYTRPERGS